MTFSRSDVDEFFAADRRSLPTPPVWDDGNRTGEMRAIPPLPVVQDGAVGPVQLVMTVRDNDPSYLMMMLMIGRYPICRLCLATGHRDAETGDFFEGPHFHDWEGSRPPGERLRKALTSYEAAPLFADLDAAFAWFLGRNRIDSPGWLPVLWPHGERLV